VSCSLKGTNRPLLRGRCCKEGGELWRRQFGVAADKGGEKKVSSKNKRKKIHEKFEQKEKPCRGKTTVARLDVKKRGDKRWTNLGENREEKEALGGLP